MARSTIEQDPAIRAAVDQALSQGATLDDIVARVREIGADVSRSAVGRYAQDYRKIADRQRDMRAVAQSFGQEFGEAGDRQSRLMIQLATTIITRAAMPIAAGDDVEMTTKELMEFGKAVQSVTSATKIDADRDARVREEARKQAKLDAADAADSAGRSMGASEETLRRIKASILGIAA
jgi:hypothetical protein